MNQKTNVYALIVILFLTQLMIGCGGTRKGFFMEYGIGGAVVASNEKLIERHVGVWKRSSSPGYTDTGILFFDAIGSILSAFSDGFSNAATARAYKTVREIPKDANVFRPYTAYNMKIGYGINDRLLISTRIVGDRLKVSGIGITYFIKKTVPSLYFDITLPKSSYSFFNGDGTMEGNGGSIGVGYEIWKHFTLQLYMNYGSQRGIDDYSPSKPNYDRPEGAIGNIIEIYKSQYGIASRSFSFGLAINMIWY